MINTPIPSASMPLPPTTRQQRITIAPVFSPENPKAIAAKMHGHRGGAGWYSATAVFAKPGASVIATSTHLDELMTVGDSQISVPGENIRILTAATSNITDAVLHTRPSDGVISRATLRVQAGSFYEAEELTHALFNGALSFLSVMSGAPIEIKALRLEEEATAIRHWTLTAIGGEVRKITWNQLPNLNLTPLPEGLRIAFASFREGLNSFNVFYKFLCFFKVAKYSLDRIKHDERKQKTKSPSPVMPSSLSGISEDDAKHLRPHIGKTYVGLIEALNPVLRDAIAHLTPGLQWISPDNLHDSIRCTEAVPVVQYIARDLLMQRFTSGRY
jgi:hypothetical protein